MLRLALISFHSCPGGRLGEKDTGGMNVYVRQLAYELGSRGHQVDVFTRCHDPQDSQIIPIGRGARVIHLKAGPLATIKEDLYQHIPEFLDELHRFQQGAGYEYDLIHSHYWMSGHVGMQLSRRWDVPHIATFHTLAHTKLRARAGEREVMQRAFGEKMIMDNADAIVVSTSVEMEDIANLYNAKHARVEVIPAGVDLQLFQPTDSTRAHQTLGLLPKEGGIILYVGRIEPLKGLDILVRAMALIDRSSDAHLVIVGGSGENDAEVQRLQTLAAELGISDRITFTGSMQQEHLPAFYSAADMFVFPSYYESFGLAPLEAMACGTPVIASRVGGLKTFIDHGETGYLIPWRCPEPFAQYIDTLLANPVLTQTMGAAARRKALGMGWCRTADTMLNCYSSVVGREWEIASNG